MQRRQFLKTSGLTLGLMSMLRNQGLADFLQQSHSFTPLRKNVGVFSMQGGTIGWLINKDGVAVVDSQFPEPAAKLISELKSRSGQPFRYLINTHHHGDHTSGNIAFKGMAQHVVAHVNSLENQKAVAARQKTEDKQLYPDKTFRDDMDFNVGDEQFKLYYFGAGHTNGDAIIHFKNANIVHMGDLVFNRKYPFIDRSAGADISNWIRVLDTTLKKFDNDTLYIFGHALDPKKVTGKADDLRAFQHYLQRLLDHVSLQVKAGKSKEDILRTTSIPGAPQWQGEGIGRSLTAAYEEIMSKG
ncbi:MAG TPA: MBL fold metallo-hydrolase [Sphingobacteriaceae bacterium]